MYPMICMVMFLPDLTNSGRRTPETNLEYSSDSNSYSSILSLNPRMASSDCPIHCSQSTSAYARRTFKPHKTRVNEARLANILDREFDGYEPRTHLASDLTYVRVGGKWAYVCLLIDLANRSIAGHSADTSRTADLVMAAFATLDFPLTEVEVFHTDRGSEFDNAKIDELLDVFDIRRSLSRKGNPYDNAVVESTNRLLKKELIYRNHYTSLEQLRSDLNDYVWWFNNQRLHSTLGYRSPKEFTEQGLVL